MCAIHRYMPVMYNYTYVIYADTFVMCVYMYAIHDYMLAMYAYTLVIVHYMFAIHVYMLVITNWKFKILVWNEENKNWKSPDNCSPGYIDMKVRKKETQNGEITSDNNLGFIIIRSDFSINLLN